MRNPSVVSSKKLSINFRLIVTDLTRPRITIYYSTVICNCRDTVALSSGANVASLTIGLTLT